VVNQDSRIRSSPADVPEPALSPVEKLRQENELLRRTIEEAEAAQALLEEIEQENGVEEETATPAAATQQPTPAAGDVDMMDTASTVGTSPASMSDVSSAPGTYTPSGSKFLTSIDFDGVAAYTTKGEDEMSAYIGKLGPLGKENFRLEERTNRSWMPQLPPVPGGLKEVPGVMPEVTGDGTACFQWDGSLEQCREHFQHRYGVYGGLRHHIDVHEGGMDKFTRSYEYYGLHRGENEGKKGLWYREWAPGAQALALVGEFNQWEPSPEHWAVRDEFGLWQLFIPDGADGSPAVKHKTKVKCRIVGSDGATVDRIPAWIRWATQEWNEIQFNGVYYDPPETSAEPGVLEEGKKYVFKYPRPPRPRALRIYECHVGMSSMEPKINSYKEFAAEVIPLIVDLGYNTVQIMAIQEHAYYGSFGYHVTNFFAPSSRFGTPDDLKYLIDQAHRYGLTVLMDIVHSHASENAQDGLNYFDGTDSCYFHEGSRGRHWMWGSRCFDYGNYEVLRFLMSNSRYWVDEFKFDGYRFDGVTSMMYHHHGLSTTFSGAYNEYFGFHTDVDAVVYLMLCNDMLHSLFPSVVTVGEDVSGMPAFCRPVSEGGTGFDYRLNMAIADKWIEFMEERTDDSWGMGEIAHTLTNRRWMEECVSYAESHDQALVGDKTLAFWLMDSDMYDYMAHPDFGPSSPRVERGIAIHKMVRLLTMTLGGESYLTFMGNEFGHPEWIDFPRDDFVDPGTGKFVPGNGGSLEKCRRRFDLPDADYLKYQWLRGFDRAMCHLDKAFGFMSAPHTYVSRKDEMDKLVVAERGDLVFVFNFHHTNSYSDYRVGCLNTGGYKVVLSSDQSCFGGYSNVSKEADVEFFATDHPHDDRPASMQVYAPARTCVVYAPSERVDPLASDPEGLGVKDLGPYFAV